MFLSTKSALLTSVICIAAAAASFMPTNSHAQSCDCTKKATAIAAVKKANVTLKQGKVIEIAYASVKEGKMADLQQKYFAKVGPIVAEYGATRLAMFQVTAKTGGEMEKPQLVGIFEWPSFEEMEAFHKDSRMQSLGKIRDGALSFFRQSFFEVKADTSIEFRSDRTYEFFSAWLNPNAGSALKDYFKASKPMKLRHGPPVFVASLSPLKGAPSSHKVLRPHMAGIVEWPSTQTYYDLSTDKEFVEKAEPLLKKAVTRLDMIHAKFMFKY